MSSASPFFFFTDTTTTEIYTLSLHDALPILIVIGAGLAGLSSGVALAEAGFRVTVLEQDRKSTRLNSSHVEISYAVFCLKKKKRQRADQADPARLVMRCVRSAWAPSDLQSPG